MKEPDTPELTEEDVDLIAECLYRPTIPGLKERIKAAIHQMEPGKDAPEPDPDKEPDREVEK